MKQYLVTQMSAQWQDSAIVLAWRTIRLIPSSYTLKMVHTKMSQTAKGEKIYTLLLSVKYRGHQNSGQTCLYTEQ